MSLIYLETLEWDSCYSYGYGNKIDFTESVVSQIIGPNGIGKSSIPLILEEVLYNKNSKKVKKADIPNRLLEEGYKIKLSFVKDGSRYEVSQERRTNVSVQLLKDGEDISSHTATNTLKQIEELLGMDFSIFSQLIYQNTSSSLKFLTETDSNRKKFLTSLFDYTEYTERFEKLKAYVKSEETELSRLQGSITTIESWFKRNENTPSELIEVPAKIDCSEEIKSAIEEYVQKEQAIKQFTEQKKRVEAKQELERKIASIDKRSLEEQLESLKAQGYSNNSMEIYKRLSELEAQYKVHSNELGKLNKLDNVCPTCHQDIDTEFKQGLIDNHTAKMEEYKQLIKENKAEADRLADLQAQENGLVTKLNNYSDLTSKLSMYSDLTFQETDIESLEKSIREAKVRVATLKDIQATSEKEANTAALHNAKVKAYLDELASFTEQRDQIEGKLDNLMDRVQELKILRDTFGPNGLIAYKLESQVKHLEQFINHYLALLSDGRFNIEFVLEKDKLNVVIVDAGRVIDITPLSSGELAKVNIATLLGIRKLMSSISKNTVNVLFLDEVISVIDDLGKERLIEVLHEEEFLNTFVVNHSWSHPLARKIEVKQEEGLSYID